MNMMEISQSILGRLRITIGILMSIVHMYFLGFNPIDPWIFLHIHLAFGLVLGLLHYPATSKSEVNKVSYWDLGLAVFPLMSAIYFILEANTIPYRVIVAPNTLDTIFSLIIIIFTLEIARRTLGWILPIISILFLIYVRYGNMLPGILGHRGYDWVTIISQSTSTSGIFGVSLSASAYYVFLLVLFSAFLRIAGAESFLIDFACAIAGRQRGGPAKIAIFASALFGTISGNSVANVVATGSITIPMMKKIGYKSDFAGAVEAVASTGGQIMPPIMGSAAFIMVELIGVSYLSIIVAALIPAILYFLSIYIMVDMQAAKEGLSCLPEGSVPPLAKVIKERGFFIIPLLVLIFSLVILKTSVVRAALWAIVSVLVVTAFKSETRMGFKKILDALYDGARISVVIISACACAGIVVGVIYLTGLGFKTSEVIILLSGENLLLALILSAIAALVLGMGVPTTASYLICAAIVAPALVRLGIIPLAAHLFVFYFACLSAITPPVALAAYAGAGLARANPMKVGFVAVKLGFVAYLVPFIFAYGQELLAMGNIGSIFVSVVTSIIGIIALASALQGWIWIREKPIGVFERLLFLSASFCTIIPGIISDLIGILLIVLAILFGLFFKSGKNN
jgi:TRAP transporter 4TM/12TM fusion protein